MAKDHLERRTYRRGPGRQYEPEYDPLRGQSGNGTGHLDTSAIGERWTSRDDSISQHSQSGRRASLLLAQRPDPRRTRQLMRQSILASKNHAPSSEEEEYDEGMQQGSRNAAYVNDAGNFNGYADSTIIEPRLYNTRNNRPTRQPQQYLDPVGEEWSEMDGSDFADPDLGYEDSLDHRSLRLPIRREQYDSPVPVPTRRNAPAAYNEAEEDYDDDYESEEEEEPREKRKHKKGGFTTRRKVLLGLGVAAVGGVAAYELAPKIPQALNDVGTNIEHQLQDAYNKGIAAGGEAVRKELIASLNTLEGVSLEGAIGAAKLTRVAYDVFVSPLVTLAATVAGDFLNITLHALITGRSWLAAIKQDNDTLAALQAVLETWTKQVTGMPKQIQSITDADLDGAQSYLHSLQLKLQQEQAKINAAPSTPTSSTPTTTRPTATP